MCVRRHTTVACTDNVHHSVFPHVNFVFLIFLHSQIKQMYIESIRHHSLLHKKCYSQQHVRIVGKYAAKLRDLIKSWDATCYQRWRLFLLSPLPSPPLPSSSGPRLLVCEPFQYSPLVLAAPFAAVNMAAMYATIQFSKCIHQPLYSSCQASSLAVSESPLPLPGRRPAPSFPPPLPPPGAMPPIPPLPPPGALPPPVAML